MGKHDELRATWAPGQIWQTRIEECAADPNAWVPVAGGGRMEPLWEERQEYRQRPDDGAKQVPLTEQLRSVPADAVLRIDTPNALGCMDTRSIPVGRLCHQAADVIGMAEARLVSAEGDNRAYCGRCDRSPRQALTCPHGERCGIRARVAAAADELFEAIEYAVLAKANGRDRGTLLTACKAKLRDVMIDAERHRESHVPQGWKRVPERFWINFCEFVSDWKNGDFDLPELACLDVQACLGALDTSGVAPTGEAQPKEGA